MQRNFEPENMKIPDLWKRCKMSVSFLQFEDDVAGICSGSSFSYYILDVRSKRDILLMLGYHARGHLKCQPDQLTSG